MDKELIKTQLHQWIEDFVEKPSSLLNNWAPCPYARQARLRGNIEIVFSDSFNLVTSVERNLSLLDDKEVIIVCFDHTDISHECLEDIVKVHNKALMPRDYVILEDHPDCSEVVNGVKMNFGKCGLLLVQRLSKLTTASDQLKEKGYYDQWPKENIDDVVAWRTQ